MLTMTRMTLPRASAAAVLTLLASSCVVTGHHYNAPSDTGVLLAERTAEDGASVQWKLYPGKDAARLHRNSTSIAIEPEIGLEVLPVTAARAEKVGAQPFTGVWVKEAKSGLPAAKAGLAAGDIVISVAGESVASPEQFAYVIAAHARPEEPLEVVLHLARRAGQPVGETSTAVVQLIPEERRVRSSSTESIELNVSRGVEAYTGMQVVALPAELAKDVYEVEESRVLVAGVVVGSPAYHAGLRHGDQVLKCGGEPVADLEVIGRAVRRCLPSQDPSTVYFDLPPPARSDPQGDRADEVSFEVEGPLGYHATTVEVDGDYDESRYFCIPILTEYESDTRSTDWEFLDFIFQFGFNYWSNTRPSATRAPAEDWEFSLFPFGMFEFEERNGEMRYTFFWLITIR